MSDPIRYREWYLDADNGKGLKNYEAYLLQYAYEDALKKLNLKLRSGFYFKQEHALTDKTDWFFTRHVDEPVYTVLDGASIALGFVGLDAAPDALNFFYSVGRGKHTEAIFSGASLFLVGPVGFSHLKYANRAVQGAEAVAEMAKRASQAYRNPYFYYSSETKQVYLNRVYQHTDRLEVQLVGRSKNSLEGGVSEVGSAVSRPIGWVEISNVSSKVRAKASYVLRIEVKRGKFTGCHSKIALEDYISKNPGARYELRNKVMDPSGSGVYEATPVIILEDGTEIVKGNNRGRSTFFPDDWDEERILKEVEHAIENNQGKKPDTWNTYTGKSMDGKVTINFFYENTLINSYYPVLTK